MGWSEIPETMPARDVNITGSFKRIAVTVDDVTYTFDKDNAVVTKDKGKIGNVAIASSVECDGKTYNIVGIADNVFKNNTNITTITIPDGVALIGNYAFSGCKSIQTISIGSGLKSIGERAFAGIDRLTDVTVSAVEFPETDRTAFENSYLDYVTLHVPYGAVEKYKTSGPWSGFKSVVAIEGTQRTFKVVYKVDGEEYKTVEVKEGEAIPSEAEPTKEGYTFSGWSEIPSVMPSEDVTITGSFTVNKYKITYKVDGEEYKVVEVDYGAAITAEDAPEKEGYEFSGWSWIPSKMPAEDVVITGTFKQVDYAVDGGTFTIDDGEATLKDGGEAKGALVINDNVTINGKVYVVVNIGDGSFKGNKDITSVELPDGIKNIGAGAFDGCSSLLKVLLGKGVRKIGSKAFGNIWKAATTRTRTSGDGFRAECNAESVPEIEADAFEGTEIDKATLIVRDELVNSYKTAEVWKNFGSVIGFTEATGVDGVFVDNPSAIIYSIDGRRLDKVQKGMNVIRTEKGVKKVVVR